MPTPLRSLVAALLAALVLPSCLAFRYEGEEVYVRHDAERDTLELALLYRGVHASGTEVDWTGESLEIESYAKATPGDVDSAARIVEAIAGGRRYFVFYDWPFLLDLDSPKLSEPLEDPDEEVMRQAAAEFADNIRVDRARLFVDDDGKLGIAQHVTMTNARLGLERLNAGLNRLLLTNRGALLGAEGEGKVEIGDLSRATLEQWVARAERGEPWIVLDGGTIEVHVPLSPAELARVVEGMVVATAAENREAAGFYVPFLRALTELTHQDGVLVARFAPKGDGWLAFEFERPNWEAQPELLELLRERDVEISAMSLEQARAFAREQ
ncbi:MAG: hypothetical protein GY711_28310 [bacterium]|nr:hypothetical protein [bacterium]